MPKLVVIEASGACRELEADVGQSVMEALTTAEVATFGDCGGALGCGTCHVVVAGEWFDRLPPPSAEEEDMLDSVFNLTPTSRLCCQITLNDSCDGLTVRLPSGEAPPSAPAAGALTE